MQTERQRQRQNFNKQYRVLIIYKAYVYTTTWQIDFRNIVMSFDNDNPTLESLCIIF